MKQFSWGAFFRGTIFLGGLFPGGNFLGGIFPGGIFPGGIFPETNWIYVVAFFTNFLSSWNKKLLLKVSPYSQENTAVFFKKRLACKQRLQQSCFPVNIAKCFGTRILKNSCERLLLCLTLGSHLRVLP